MIDTERLVTRGAGGVLALIALLLSVNLMAVASLAAESPRAIAEIDAGGGAVVRLFEEPRMCVSNAKYAEWQSADATTTVGGCWVLSGNLVSVAFLDGEGVALPARAMRKPTEA